MTTALDRLKQNGIAGVEPKPWSENGVLHPSPVCRVVFGSGKVLVLNRRDRRKMKLYGNRVKKRCQTS